MLLSFLSSKARDWSLTLVSPCTRTKKRSTTTTTNITETPHTWPGAQGLFNHLYHVSSCLRPIGLPHRELPSSTPIAYCSEGLVQISTISGQSQSEKCLAIIIALKWHELKCTNLSKDNIVKFVINPNNAKRTINPLFSSYTFWRLMFSWLMS